MRTPAPMLIALTSVLAACADLDGPSNSEFHGMASEPPWSVVMFGVSRIDVPAQIVDPRAINDLGQVAGRQGGPNGAFLWANGTTQLLTGEDDNAASVGRDMNAFGLVVGHGGRHASAWEDGGYAMLAPFEPDGGAAATAVNDGGLIVGTDQPLDPDNPRLGLVWRDRTQAPLLLQARTRAPRTSTMLASSWAPPDSPPARIPMPRSGRARQPHPSD